MSFSKINPYQFPNIPYEYSKLRPKDRAQLRSEYIIRQSGKCWFCKESLVSTPSAMVLKAKLNMNLFPQGFLRNPVHLHHNHENDLTIGAVHAECNAYLWQYLGE